MLFSRFYSGYAEWGYAMLWEMLNWLPADWNKCLVVAGVCSSPPCALNQALPFLTFSSCPLIIDSQHGTRIELLSIVPPPSRVGTKDSHLAWSWRQFGGNGPICSFEQAYWLVCVCSKTKHSNKCFIKVNESTRILLVWILYFSCQPNPTVLALGLP